jgi:hypothetical protein
MKMRLVLEIVLALVVVLFGATLWREHHRAAELEGYYKQVNDSTVAEVAAWKAKAHSLEALKDAAKEEKGKLVAGVQIRTKPDTVYVPAKVVLTKDSSGTRTASLTDTTKMGIEIKVDAEAPPYPAPLKLGYNLVVPEFTPEVGFMKKGDFYVALVSWAGQEFTVENAFHLPEKPLPRFEVLAGANEYASIDGKLDTPQIYAGVNLRVSGKDWVGLIGKVGWGEEGRIGLRWERKLWSR